MHAMLGARYGVALVSVRDALYDYLWQDGAVQLNAALGVSRSRLLQDTKHPTALGSELYGRGLAAFTVRELLRQQLLQLAAGGDDAGSSPLRRGIQPQQQQQQQRLLVKLPAAISPIAAQYVDLPTWCAEGESFKDYVIGAENGTVNGWQWTVSSFSRHCDLGNCQVAGYAAEAPGQQLHIRIDTASAAAAAALAADLPTGRHSRRTAGSAIELNLLKFTGTRPIAPGRNIGQGQVECVSGCSCLPTLLGPYRANSTEVQRTGIAAAQVRVGLGML
jgi:hypothetical protein